MRQLVALPSVRKIGKNFGTESTGLVEISVVVVPGFVGLTKEVVVEISVVLLPGKVGLTKEVVVEMAVLLLPGRLGLTKEVEVPSALAAVVDSASLMQSGFQPKW